MLNLIIQILNYKILNINIYFKNIYMFNEKLNNYNYFDIFFIYFI